MAAPSMSLAVMERGSRRQQPESRGAPSGVGGGKGKFIRSLEPGGAPHRLRCGREIAPVTVEVLPCA
jgi:hypothetical protein